MVDSLVAWFEENQRRLPWRSDYDPYHVWLSEVMLQQTQVDTVLPYYQKFLEEFPTIHILAEAPEDRVLKLWAGLGYYRRAKNFHAAAREVVHKHGGTIPSEYDALIALPGIGQYMAGAILSIAFNKPYPIVDGNVRRVVSRINGWMDDNPKAQWDAARRLASSAEPRMVNQALMELGATICSFKSPRCLLCPIRSSCLAFKAGKQDQIPPVKKRPETVHVHVFAIVHRRGRRFLMKPAEGLWEFPMFPELPAGSFQKIGSCRHTITHHRLEVSVYTGVIQHMEGYRWMEIEAVPISSLTRKVEEIFSRGLHG